MIQIYHLSQLMINLFSKENPFSDESQKTLGFLSESQFLFSQLMHNLKHIITSRGIKSTQ
jgi:hypothetical protein